MSSNPNSSDFHYKEYSLKQLDNWVNDALNCDDLSPQDIYNTIIQCVDESVEYHKKYLDKSIKLLSLLKGNRDIDFNEPYDGWDYTATGEKFPRACDRDDPSPECKKDWVDFWEETYYPEEHKQYTEEEMDAMCERAATEEYKQKCREYNLREAEYYNKRAKLDAEYEAIKAAGGYEWTPLPETKKDEVKKWRLPVEETKVAETDETEYFITFPDDLLEAADLKEGDNIEWVDQGNGSYLLKKIEKKPMTYDEMVADGWTMTADGFWIRA
jgi:bifunctional DNA-binding transcriptional regulator/antitoxin component of YhaV-PrlF toxin-antitoxin module